MKNTNNTNKVKSLVKNNMSMYTELTPIRRPVPQMHMPEPKTRIVNRVYNILKVVVIETATDGHLHAYDWKSPDTAMTFNECDYSTEILYVYRTDLSDVDEFHDNVIYVHPSVDIMALMGVILSVRDYIMDFTVDVSTLRLSVLPTIISDRDETEIMRFYLNQMSLLLPTIRSIPSSFREIDDVDVTVKFMYVMSAFFDDNGMYTKFKDLQTIFERMSTCIDRLSSDVVWVRDLDRQNDYSKSIRTALSTRNLINIIDVLYTYAATLTP